MNYTLYRIVDRKADHDRVVMYMTDMNGMWMDRFWDFGAISVFDVAKILRIWEGGGEYRIESISKTDFIRKFGKDAVAF